MSHGMNYIDGRWVPGSLGTLAMENPSYETRIGEIARSGEADVDVAVSAAQKSLAGEWGSIAAADRGRLLHRVAAAVRDHVHELSALESADCGKPLRQACADALLAARYFEYYAGAADKIMGETIPYQSGFSVLTWRERLGVTGHIIPWNYPLQMTGRTLAPALAAGNATVLKPAEDACLSIVRLFQLVAEAGFPAGAVNLVTGLGEEAGAALARHPGLNFVSFTGSPEVGQLVTEASAPYHRPVLLELGGKSPQIVFPDADLDQAIPVIVNAIIQNSGQTCSAGSRVLVHRDIYETVATLLAERFERLRVGPADTDPDLGPIINRRQKLHVEECIRRAQEEGMEVIASAAVPEPPGHFVPPVVFGHVPRQSFLAQSEVFGPVLALIPFREEREAVGVANDTPYGLVCGLWTRDVARAFRIARKVCSGQVFINTYGAGGGVELPFGGMKRSGHGREKGVEALRHVTALKTVVISHG